MTTLQLKAGAIATCVVIFVALGWSHDPTFGKFLTGTALMASIVALVMWMYPEMVEAEIKSEKWVSKMLQDKLDTMVAQHKQSEAEYVAEIQRMQTVWKKATADRE